MDTLDPAAVENVKKLQAEICTILTGKVFFALLLCTKIVLQPRFSEGFAINTGHESRFAEAGAAAEDGDADRERAQRDVDATAQEPGHAHGLAHRRGGQGEGPQLVRQFVLEQRRLCPLQTPVSQSDRGGIPAG